MTPDQATEKVKEIAIEFTNYWLHSRKSGMKYAPTKKGYKFWLDRTQEEYFLDWIKTAAAQTLIASLGGVGEDGVDYKAKYEKCINIIKRFDPGIIGLYDL